MSLIKINQNIVDAILLFNKLDSSKAEAILIKIFSSPTSKYSELFTEKELNKLLALLKINEEQLNNIVRAFSFLLMHAVAERNIKDVEQTLAHIGLNQAHIVLFQKQWVTYGNEYTIKIRERPVAIQQELKEFTWSISLPLESSKLPLKNATHLREDSFPIDHNEELYSIDAKNPQLILNMLLQQEDGSNSEKFAVRLEKAQIQNLFENLEKIQDQLDLLL
ncbi:hypothetical protein ABPG74_012417 [Tetrahymena malaccensis]